MPRAIKDIEKDLKKAKEDVEKLTEELAASEMSGEIGTKYKVGPITYEVIGPVVKSPGYAIVEMTDTVQMDMDYLRKNGEIVD